MRFLADMGISPSVVYWLRNAGHDALHLREENMQRSPDQIVLEKACADNRILLTADLDFGYLLAISGASLPTVVLFRLSDMRPSNVWTKLNSVISRYEDEAMNGAFVVVTDTMIRVRHLPIGEGE